MNVLLSIKPEYVEKIIKGKKLYEFRRSLFSKEKMRFVKKVYIYSSAPVQKIVARFILEEILEEHPEILWEECKEYSGIEKDEFFEYFKNIEKGFAIKITNLRIYKQPLDPNKLIPNFTPPQSFCYVDYTPPLTKFF